MTASRGQDGRFLGGSSGNPAGRPRGFRALAAHVRRETNDGAELVDFALAVLRDATLDVRARFALCWLSNRGWEKPLVAVDIEVSSEATPPEAMTPLEREQRIDELLAKRTAAKRAQIALPDQDETSH